MTTNDHQPILDPSAVPPSLRETIAALYRDFEAAARDIGHARLAGHCAREAAALEAEGRVPLATLLEAIR